MGIRIEIPETEEALTDFVGFHDRVYAYREAFWPALLPFQLPVLQGQTPFNTGRTIRPMIVRDGSEIVARAMAVVDELYLKTWNEEMGHVVWFEALSGAREATRLLMDSACDWLAANGMQAARCGFGAFNDWCFTTDEYDLLPPNFVRQNPAYYHSLLKDAGFESEKGWVDYKIEVTPELVDRWEQALAVCRADGFSILPLTEIPPDRRTPDFLTVWNEAFSEHWGVVDMREEEFGYLLQVLGPLGMLDVSVIAYLGDEPVGVLWVNPPMTGMARLKKGRQLHEMEKLNTLGIGVARSARGRGVNLAMAAYSYLELVKRGSKFLSYTMVLDDNWRSRRTAEKLGAYVCANYLVYRRNFSR